MPVYATIFSFASLLGWFDPASSFLRGLNQEWLSDVQEFLHTGLPKLLFIGLYVWVLILVVNVHDTFLPGSVKRCQRSA